MGKLHPPDAYLQMTYKLLILFLSFVAVSQGGKILFGECVECGRGAECITGVVPTSHSQSPTAAFCICPKGSVGNPYEECKPIQRVTETRTSTNKSTSCETVGGPDEGKPCVFPFKMNNITFNGCITDEHEEEHADTCSPDRERFRSRCSTHVDEEGHHVLDHWGFCGDECPLHKAGHDIECGQCGEYHYFFHMKKDISSFYTTIKSTRQGRTLHLGRGRE